MIAAYLAVERLLAWASALLLAATGVFLSWEVVSRYFFNAPTIWAAELSQLCLIWACPMAMGWALSERRHIRVDAVTRLLGDRARQVAELVALLAVAIFAAVVTVYGFDIFHDSFERGRTTGTMLDLPAWIPEASIPAGFGLLFISALVNMARTWKDGAPKPDGEIHE
ncbi:TRAP transporter small permease [Rhodovulum sp. DZ06]|uniref:TRAP transporter small permease n=1 Tax=Rhodovulum sp. DZ06 TaxID=3425126 RepID=UPI003D34A984